MVPASCMKTAQEKLATSNTQKMSQCGILRDIRAVKSS